MKTLISLLLGLVLTAALSAAELKNLPADRFQAAGLHKLTAAELAELETVFEQLKSGEITAIREEAEQKVAAAEAKAQQTEVEQKKSGPNWLRALVTLQSTNEKAGKADPVLTRIEGNFRGWRGKTLFRLENGQVWQQDDDSSYVGVNFESPAVKIYPGMFGSFWMEVENVRPRVRVKPLKLQ